MFTRLLIYALFLLSAQTAGFAKAEPPKPKDGPLGMKFVSLPEGTTYLGWNGQRGSAKKTEIKEDFEIAVHTVTQGQWISVMGKNPSLFSRDGIFKENFLKDRDDLKELFKRDLKEVLKDIRDEDLKQFPIEGVSWNDCQEFVKKLNEKEKGNGYVYRLPTEAEWEYACRGGATTEEECSFHFYFAKPTNDLSSEEANFAGGLMFDKDPFLKRPTKVGSYSPNNLGLYDMHGNVLQWCSDLFNPKEETATSRVARGGHWLSLRSGCRAGSRYEGGQIISLQIDPFLCGLRLVRFPSAIPEPTPRFANTEPPKPKDGPLGMNFASLPKGTTYLGWDGTKGSAKKTEIKESFEIAIHTVTQEQWKSIMGKNPSFFSRDGRLKQEFLKGDDMSKKLLKNEMDELEKELKDIKDEDLKQFPVEGVSWNDCQEFVKKLNEKEKGKGYVYRLPTEAEWEYACRGGATTKAECSFHFYFTKPTNDLSVKEANIAGEWTFGFGGKQKGMQRPTKVGSYSPNKLGLYDMHGNVLQWCSDLFDPKEETSSSRVARGGHWFFDRDYCRAASRYDGGQILQIDPSLSLSLFGLRLVRVPSTPADK